MEKRYCLVTVCDREIYTEFFETFAQARNSMLQDIQEEYQELKDKWGSEVELIGDRIHEAHIRKGNCAVLSWGETWGWSNVDDYFPYDWKIFQIK